MAAKKDTKEKKPTIKKKSKKQLISLTALVIGKTGRKAGTVTLPENVFGQKPNKTIVAQAVCVYLSNQRQGGARTRTRGEITGSSRKIWRQKGTGRARHGDRYAPIFVGGGVAHGPRPRNWKRAMSAKMKKKALCISLSQQYRDGNIIFINDVSSIEPKTKDFIAFLAKIGVPLKRSKVQKSLLFVTDKAENDLYKAARNVECVTVRPAHLLNTYEVVNNQQIIMVKNAISILSIRSENSKK